MTTNRKTLLDLLAWNSAFPNSTRAILKGFAGGLNSRIIILLQQHLREERKGKPDTGEQAHPESSVTGPEIDTANEATGAAVEKELENEHREEVGFMPTQEPLEVAGRLRSLNEFVAVILLDNARVMLLPGGRRGPDEFHLAPSIANSLQFKAQAGPRINMAALKAEAETFGVDVDRLVAREKTSNERLRGAVMRDAERLLELYEGLRSIGADGHELETEASFDLLHPVDQERVLISLDRAAYNHYESCVNDVVRGRKDARTDAFHVNGFRWEIRDAFACYLADPRFTRLLDAAEQRPEWLKDPMKQIGDRKVA